MKIAAMAEVYEVNCAPHNFYGHLCSAISATFSAVAPNFRVMEIDIDSAPWRDEFYMAVPVIENGEFVLPMGPGCRAIDVNEKASARTTAERLEIFYSASHCGRRRRGRSLESCGSTPL